MKNITETFFAIVLLQNESQSRRYDAFICACAITSLFISFANRKLIEIMKFVSRTYKKTVLAYVVT